MVAHFPFSVFLLDAAWKSLANSSTATSRSCGFVSSTSRPRERSLRCGASQRIDGNAEEEEEEEGAELTDGVGVASECQPKSGTDENFLAFF